MTRSEDQLQEIVETPAPDLAKAPFTWSTLRAISKTEFVPGALRGKPEAILAAILAGRELGMGPMESLRVIDMIDGKPSPSAEWMVGKVLGAGHLVYAEEQSADRCTVTGIRREQGEEVGRMSFTFTMDMAQRAGLANKSNWKKYPEAMLYWRATAQLCRQFFSDVLRGLKYLPEELGDEDWTPPHGNYADDMIPVEGGSWGEPATDPSQWATARPGDPIQVVDVRRPQEEPPVVIEGQETLEYAEDDPERPF